MGDAQPKVSLPGSVQGSRSEVGDSRALEESGGEEGSGEREGL